LEVEIVANREFSLNANPTKRKKPKPNKFWLGVATSDRRSESSIGDARSEAANYFMAASAAIANGDEVAAIDMMNRAIELAPTNSSYYSFRALAKSAFLLAGYDADEIMADFDHAVDLAPDNPMAWWMRAKFKGKDLRSLEAARLDLDYAIKLSPNAQWMKIRTNIKNGRGWID
jgi:tetratricopeptide (TPR) repeat protein